MSSGSDSIQICGLMNMGFQIVENQHWLIATVKKFVPKTRFSYWIRTLMTKAYEKMHLSMLKEYLGDHWVPGLSPQCLNFVLCMFISITVTLHESHDISNHWQFNYLFKSLLRLKKASKHHITGPLWGESTSWFMFLSLTTSDAESIWCL